MNDTQEKKYSSKELLGAFFEKRLSENLEAFKKHLPDIYAEFECYQEKRFFLIYDQDGNINVFDRENEKNIYQVDPVYSCYKNLDDYLASPIQRPYLIAKPSDGKKDQVNYIHSTFLGKLAEIQHDVLGQVFEGKIRRVLGETEGAESASLPSNINVLFVMSTGIGLDIEKLYLERTVNHLIIVEPSLDAFYLSLQVMDWASIIDKSISEGLDIHFVLGDDLISGVSNAVSSIGRHNIAGSFLYSGFFTDEFKDIYKQVKDAMGYSYLTGFGFYDDSRYSLSHTMGNIKNDVPIFSTNRKISKNFNQSDVPVFIVGNGPSLDDSIDFIKKNQGRAIIFCCGSSLRPLMHYGVDPDYFVELERTASVTRFINESADGISDFYKRIENIKFIGVSQMHPETFNFFNKRGQILKDTETGTMLAHNLMKESSVPVLARLAPTCVHTAVTMATVMGFRNIYFFGVDMGTLDVSKHHSKHSAYNKLTEEMNASLSISKDGEVYKSNLGDKEVFSSSLYPMFKRELESILAGWKANFGDSLNYYNCSDGALIEGAEPQIAEEIKFTDKLTPADIELVASDVFDAFFSVFTGEFYQQALEDLEQIICSVENACDWANKAITPVSSRLEAHNQIDRFVLDFHSDVVFTDESAWLYSVFDGSLLYAFSLINSTIQLPANEEFVISKVNEQFEALKDFFVSLKADFRESCLEWDEEERYTFLFGENS